MKRLSRRTVLRGAGVALGLPLLDAMLDGRGVWSSPAVAADPSAPIYLLSMMVPNGTYTIEWFPAETGPTYALVPKVVRSVNWLEPLAPHRNDFTLLSGLFKEQGTLNKDINNDGHARGTATFAVGEPISLAGAGGPSFDQVAAAELGGTTRFRSVAAAIGGVTDPHWSYISWTAKDQPLSPYRDPAQMFQDLFGATPAVDPDATPPPNYGKSVLDFVKDDLARLQTRVGGADRVRLDAHLSALRDLERQLASTDGSTPVPTGPAACRRPDVPAATADLSNERVQLMLDLQLMAFACDLTRFGSFQMGSRADERVFSWLGISDGHHTVSHDYTVQGETLREKMWNDEIEQFALLLAKMKEIRVSADSTLLDQSVVFFGSEHSESDIDGHYQGDLPLIVAGRGGGRLKTGQHLRFQSTDGYTYSDVLLTLLQVVGSAATSFGPYGTKSVPGILV